MFGENTIMLFDDPTSKDSSFRLLEKKTNLQLGMTTINEERERDGLEPVEWGDVPLIQMNMMPLGEEKESREIIDVDEDKQENLDKWLNEVFTKDTEASEDLKD